MFEPETPQNQSYKPGVVTLKTLKTRSPSLPSLCELLRDLDVFDGLPEEDQNAIYAEAAAVEAMLRAKVLGRHHVGAQPAPKPECAVGITEAATLLGMSKDYLFRHWKQLGGYKDDDRHVKFPMS